MKDLSIKTIFILTVLSLLSANLLLSQTETGQITGTITDPAGAAIPRANVATTNVETGVSFKSVTGAQGEYGIPALPAAKI